MTTAETLTALRARLLAGEISQREYADAFRACQAAAAPEPTNAWQTIAGFVDRYRTPGSPTGAQVVAKLQERSR